MQCLQCRHENSARREVLRGMRGSAGARVCANCGAPCRRPPSSARNARIPPASSRPPASRLRRARKSYTPKHLAEKILTSKAALEGERKQVTVLFADLKGSMELLADRDPEEARKLLDPVLERMMEAVHRYEGTVNQVMGDGIMALFGAPLAHEDHAVRACYAALRMQESREALRGRGAPRRTGVEVQIRVGLNSGEVVVRADRQRSAHGLHGGRPDHPPGGAHGAAGAARDRPADRRDPAARGGLRRGQVARAHPREGPRGPDRGLRADGGGRRRARACRPRRSAASRASSAATPRSSTCAGSSARPAPAAARWSPSSARPGWASRGSSTSSPTRIGCRTG